MADRELLEKLSNVGISVAGDIQIGAVELKNRATDDRAVIDSNGNLHVKTIDDTLSISFESSKLTIGTTATQLPNIPATHSVSLMADSDNTGEIYFYKDNTVSNTKAGLKKGQTAQLKVDNSNRVWVVASAAGQILNLVVD